jgi:hypothetical protein
MICFTTAIGEHGMCAVVVAARRLTALEACGFNLLSDDFLGPETPEEKWEKINTSLVETAYSPWVQNMSSKEKKCCVLLAVRRTV